MDPIKCPRCKSGQVYIRIDKSIVCRRCGFDSKRQNKV